MVSADDPCDRKKDGYAVPMPRATDALGTSLRRVFSLQGMPPPLADLIRRLNAIR